MGPSTTGDDGSGGSASPSLPASKKLGSSPVRPEPSSTQGRSHVWDPPLEVLGDGGALLDARSERVLGRQTLAVWRHLVAYRGDAYRGMVVSYQRVATDTGVPYRTVERLMRRLAEAGLVSKHCTRVRRQDGFTSNVVVEALGYCGPGVDWVPKATIAWCESRPQWGGLRTRKMRSVTENGGESVAPKQEVTGASCGVYESLNTQEANTPSSIEEGGAPGGAPFSPLRGFIDQHSIPKKSLQLPKLTGDPDDPDTRTRSLVRLGWIQHLVNAYNAAYRAAGVNTFQRLPGKTDVEFSTWDGGKPSEPNTQTGKARAPHDPAIERWKHYRPLLEAGRALQGRNIAPDAWAAWAVQRAKGKVLPINRIFMASHVESNAHRHMFRQESGYGYGEGNHAIAPKQEHFEQMYRLREVRHRERGITTLYGFPPWYADLRKQEIAQGVEDPMVRFPVVIKGRP